MTAKETTRRLILDIRNGLPAETRRKKSLMIAHSLEALSAFQKAKHVLLYYAIDSEVETETLLEKYMKGKQLYLPVIQDDQTFRAFSVNLPLDLMTGRAGVPEPRGGKEAGTLDLIVVPGVAFDKKGGRLGTGKGYYDRFLPTHPKTIKVGLAFQEQMVENCPLSKYDYPVDLIITDQTLYERP